MLRRAFTLGLCLALSACGLFGSRTDGPDRLSVYDGDLRHFARQGRFDDALELAESDGDAAGDNLLAMLNLGTLNYYEGSFESSNDYLLAADIVVDDRFTKSASRAAVSMITNDRVLAWLPSRHERLMMHVYGALNYVALGELDEAAVEARLLSQLLDEMGELEPKGANQDVYRTLRYFAGAVFESAGEWTDAEVAYRNAGFDNSDESSRNESGPELGEVVVLLESGFVANRVEQSVNILLNADDADYLRHGSDRFRYHAASCLSHERMAFAYESFGASLDADDDCPRRRRPRKRRRNDHDDDDDDELEYLLRVAWPVMQRSSVAIPISYVRAFATSSTLAVVPDASAATMIDHEGEALLSGDLSGAMIHEFHGRAPGILIKAVARAAAKYMVVKALAGDSETAQVVGNAVTALLERADTRSWTLLPSDLHIVRLPLPVGTHQLLVEFDGAGSGGPSLVLDDVQVSAGRVTVVSARAWP